MKTNIIEIKTQSELEEHKSNITGMNIVAIDTETTGFDPFTKKPILFQIGDPEVQYIIYWYKVSLEPLREFLEHSNARKIFQNHKFDYKFIKHHANMEIDKNIWDTMLAEQLIDGGRSKGIFSLEAMANKYLGVQLNKESRNWFMKWDKRKKIPQSILNYAAEDVIAPFHIARIQEQEIKKQDMGFVSKLEFACSSALADIEYNGFYLDTSMWRLLEEESIEQLNKTKKNLDKLFAPVCNLDLFGTPSVNYDSQEQLLEYLNKLGIDVPNTEKATLSKIKDNPIIENVLAYRKWTKGVRTYGQKFAEHINPVTLRIHSSFQQILATGRTASRRPNLQNIIAPKEEGDLNYRAPFKAQNPAHRILTADYSGCELRILAHISKDPVLMDTFQSETFTGIEADVHAAVATLMYGVPVSKTENPKLRKNTKSINFGLIYGMGAKKLANDLGIPIKEAKALIKLYFKTMPSIEKHLAQASYEAVQLGRSVTVSGRKRYYNIPNIKEMMTSYEPTDKELEKAGGNKFMAVKNKHDAIIAHIENCGKNTPCQGGNGDITKLALINLRKDIKENKRPQKMINTVHDEIVFEGPDMEGYAPIAARIMEEAEAYFLTDIPPRVDCIIDKSWSK